MEGVKVQKTDDMLIAEIKDGSFAAFDQLMKNYEYEVYRVAYSFTRDIDSALDVSQNVFLKTYENLNTFRGSSTFKTWLLRIAWNESMNWIKKNKHLRMHQNFDDLDISSDQNTELDVLAVENKVMLLRSLYGLNTRYRLAVVLRYFENYAIRDIAVILNCSEGVVKNILFRSLQKMKQALLKSEVGACQ